MSQPNAPDAADYEGYDVHGRQPDSVQQHAQEAQPGRRRRGAHGRCDIALQQPRAGWLHQVRIQQDAAGAWGEAAEACRLTRDGPNAYVRRHR